MNGQKMEQALSQTKGKKTLEVEEAGTYTLTIQNIETGCKATASAKVTERTTIDSLQLPTDTSLDCNDSIKILSIVSTATADDLVYNWTTNNGNIITAVTIPEIRVNQPGVYRFSINSTLSGCSIMDSIRIGNNRIFPVVDLGEDRLLRCDEPSILLSSLEENDGPIFQYEWKDNANNIVARTVSTTIDKAGTYSLQITNSDNGCQTRDEIVIEQNLNFPEVSKFAVNEPACKNSKNASINIEEIVGGMAPYELLLNNMPSVENNFDNLSAGIYNLTLTDALGCQWDSTITIEAPSELAIEIIASANELLSGDMINLSIGGSTPSNTIALVDWQPAELFPCSDCPDQTVPVFMDTEISLSIIDENGCEGFASTFIQVELAEMPNAITPNGDGMNDFLKIPAIEADPDGHPDNEIVIFNRWGDVVYRATPYQNDWDGTNNGQELPEGTYYYVVRLDVSEGVTMTGMVTILK